jgi:hypothetical protein
MESIFDSDFSDVDPTYQPSEEGSLSLGSLYDLHTAVFDNLNDEKKDTEIGAPTNNLVSTEIASWILNLLLDKV